MEKKNYLQSIPDTYSFITVREEAFGGYLFNTYLFNELPLNRLEMRVLELCNGNYSIEDILRIISNDFGLSEKYAETATINSLNHFNSCYAINWRKEKKKGSYTPKNVGKITNKPQDYYTEDYYSAPLSVIFELTNRCNLKCKHCLVDAGESIKKELSFNEIKTVIDQLKQNKVFKINFGGGEPLLRDDFIDILEYASELNFGIVFSTNGFLIDDSILDKLENIKTFAVQVSVDGLEKTHDDFRGVKGSFEKAVRALKNFSERGYYTIMSTMMLKINIDELESLIDLSLSNGVSSFKLSTFMPAGRGNKNIDELSISPVDIKNLAERMVKLKKEYVEKLDMDIQGTFPWLLDGKQRKPSEKVQSRHTKVGCSAGRSNIVVTPTGDVLPCPFLRDFVAGNLCTDNLKNIWEESEVFGKFRNISATNLKGKCKDCKYIPYFCQGGCRAAAFLQTGDFYSEDTHCWYVEK